MVNRVFAFRFGYWLSRRDVGAAKVQNPDFYEQTKRFFQRKPGFFIVYIAVRKYQP